RAGGNQPNPKREVSHECNGSTELGTRRLGGRITRRQPRNRTAAVRSSVAVREPHHRRELAAAQSSLDASRNWRLAVRHVVRTRLRLGSLVIARKPESPFGHRLQGGSRRAARRAARLLTIPSQTQPDRHAAIWLLD